MLSSAHTFLYSRCLRMCSLATGLMGAQVTSKKGDLSLNVSTKLSTNFHNFLRKDLN